VTQDARHVRIARPTVRLDACRHFYTEVLGFTCVGEFFDHDGYSGVMIGYPGAGWHLEFTTGSSVTPADEDDLLVLYIPDEQVQERLTTRLHDAGHSPVKSANPYWDRCGRTYEDPDGRRIVLAFRDWHNEPENK